MILLTKRIVDLGFAIKHEIKILKKSGKLNDNRLRNLRSHALEFLMKLCIYFNEKRPLKNKPFIRTSCLSPKLMLEPAQLTLILLDKKLEILVSLKKTTSAIAMEVKIEYSKFLSSVVNKD